jgi:hypothetical protein
VSNEPWPLGAGLGSPHDDWHQRPDITIVANVFGFTAVVVAIWLYVTWPSGASVVVTPLN